jgi:transcription elongation factor SPT6
MMCIVELCIVDGVKNVCYIAQHALHIAVHDHCLCDDVSVGTMLRFSCNNNNHQRFLRGSTQQLLRSMECKLVDAVCEVGVDLNTAVAHPHRAAMLAFVGGLGLRKADVLRMAIRRSAAGIVMSRSDLLTRKMLDKVVWTNAVGFLKITNPNAADEDEDENAFERLDNTRIHPECYITYNIALKICVDALDMELSTVRTTADRNAAVHQIMWKSKDVLNKRIKKTPQWLDLWEHGRPHPDAVVSERRDPSLTLPQPSSAPVGVELPDALYRLMLDEYAGDLVAQGMGRRRLQMEHIKDELRYPWLDLRPSCRSISAAELFSLLTNESDYSLFVGLKVGCTIIEISDKTFSDSSDGSFSVRRQQRAIAKLDSGNLRAVINATDITDQRVELESFNMSDYIRVGSHIVAVVVGVSKDKLQVDLSVKPSHMAMNEAAWLRARNTDRNAIRWWQNNCVGRNPSKLFDPSFQEESALEIYSASEATATSEAEKLAAQYLAESTGGMFARPMAGNGGDMASDAGKQQPNSVSGSDGGIQKMRRVVHPQFANVDYKEAEKKLKAEGKGAGAIIVRPSSKGTDWLTVTWAFQDGIYKHIAVKENNKRPGDLGLGTELMVESWDEPFSDIDHLFVMYIEPMNDLVFSMKKHIKFLNKTYEEVVETMRADLAANPQRIPYYLCFDKENVGSFLLTWMSPNQNSANPVKKQRIVVQPNVYNYQLHFAYCFL